MKPQLIILLFALTLGLFACGEPVQSSPHASPPEPTALPAPVYAHVGQTVNTGAFAITLKTVTLVDPGSIPQIQQIYPDLKTTDRFLELAIQIQNVSGQSQQFAGMWFHVADAFGNQDFTEYPTLPGHKSATGVGGILAPGSKQQGLYRYRVPVTLQSLSWIYTAQDTHAQVIWNITWKS